MTRAGDCPIRGAGLRAAGKGEDVIRELIEAAEQAVAADPAGAAALRRLGIVLSHGGEIARGETMLRRAADARPGDPETAAALGVTLLRQGRFDEGWTLRAARRLVPGARSGLPPEFDRQRWSGESLAGKRIVVLPERTLSDALLFARCIPPLIDRAGQVILVAPPLVAQLLRESFPGAHILIGGGAIQLPSFDHWIALGDLPEALRGTPEGLPQPPYLRTILELGNPPRGFKIGLSTGITPAEPDEAGRSLPAELAAALRQRLPGTVIDLDAPAIRTGETGQAAAIVKSLDLVVSVDGWAAHLAGALGKPSCVLLPAFNPAWCWMTQPDRSPWYPSLTLYRAAADGDWTGAIDRLVTDIERIAAEAGETEEAAPAPAREALERGLAELAERRFDAALGHLREAVAADPTFSTALFALGQQLTRRGRPEEGEPFARRAVAMAPHHAPHRLSLAINLLTQGRYAEAWPLFEARTEILALRNGYPRNIAIPHWGGEDLTGRVIAVFPEEGFGDQIQYARFIPWLRQRAGRVVIAAKPELLRLFALSFPDLEVCSTDGGIDDLRAHCWVTTSELPGLAGATPESLPTAAYLRAPPASLPPGGGLRIGVKTLGSPTHPNPAKQSLSDAAAERLIAALPGTVIDLDPAVSGARDFADTAAIMAGLDLVISVDTAAAHLAGALGKRGCVLLAGFGVDWRWGAAGEVSPWYPTLRLYRGRDDDHDPAIARVIDDVTAMAREHPRVR